MEHNGIHLNKIIKNLIVWFPYDGAFSISEFFLFFLFILGTAFRECDSNGSWFIHPDTGQPWSNYSTCIDFEDLEVIFSLFAFYESRC